MGQTESAGSDQDMVTTSNHSEETQDRTIEPELQMRYRRKILRPKKWIEGQAQKCSNKT